MSTATTKTRAFGLLIAGAAALCLLLATASSAFAAAPVWQIHSVSNSYAAPGGTQTYLIQLTNVGDAAAEGAVEPLVLEGSLPAGMSALGAVGKFGAFEGWDCSGTSGATLSCVNSTNTIFDAKEVGGGNYATILLTVAIDSEPAPILTPTFQVSGGGAAKAASTADPTRISSAPTPFGLEAFDFQIDDKNGAPYEKAGGHPEDIVTYLDLNSAPNPVFTLGDHWPVHPLNTAIVDLPPGLAGNPTVLGTCTMDQLVGAIGGEECAPSAQIGTVKLRLGGSFSIRPVIAPTPLFNMIPPPGVAARFAFNYQQTVVAFDARLRQGGDYGVLISTPDASEGLPVIGSEVTFWGNPGAVSHDSERACGEGQNVPGLGGPTCKGSEQGAFLRTPTSCPGPGKGEVVSAHVSSWAAQEDFDSTTIETHKAPGYPYNPEDPTTPWGENQGMGDCASVPVQASLDAQPTSRQTETPSGLAVHVEVPNPGLENPAGIASSDIKATEVSLPRGMTINPSQAEGLGTCDPARFESTVLSFYPTPGKGCPDDSKIGTVEVKSPLLEEKIPGEVFVAKPYENPFDSLLAIYVVLAEPERGVLVKLPGEVRTDEKTGQIVTSFKDLPQLPFESFDFKFREGARAPLVTPPNCGTYTTEARFTPWSDPDSTLTSKSDFQITSGIGGAPCPPGGTPAFRPTFSAGSINNNAGSFSPFNMRLTRADGEQDMTRFSAVLPPGVLGRLAGVAKCPEAAIAAAKAKTGLEERANPSCPASSAIGRSLVGAGVGSVLTYIPGKIYLGGPFHGDPLSVIAITPAVAGPFDVGTVVVHEALTLNPKTAEVEVDGSASDPIPHILKGIPAKVRDLRVYVDRPDFTLNPTSCAPSSAKATLFGGGPDAFTSIDDIPVSLSDRYQAANCQSLGFKPKLALKLKGGTRRGAHPGLKATYTPRKGDANIKGLVVRLPRSAFLEQAHIRTICTRVQFAAKACPPGAIYGHIKAWTPLLDEPLEGPVYLRSSNHKLPDLLFALHGLVDVEVSSRIDSVGGGIRATVEEAPDAPLSKVVLHMQGAKKGLIVNSRNLCRGVNRAVVAFAGHNGKVSDSRPPLRPRCGKARPHHRRG